MSSSHVFLLFCFCVTLLFQLHFAFATSNSSGLTLKAFLDDSPHSPLYGIENLTLDERMEKLIKLTDARVKYLDLVLNPNASTVVPDTIPLGILREGLYYAVQFAMGSQGHIVKLLLDTGSGLTWTQCIPCRPCFPQHLPIFDPSHSATYAKLPCNHHLCQGQDSMFTCVDGECQYRARYIGGAYTKGVGAMETVHFFIDEHHVQSFDDFVFGCSSASQSIFFQDTDISGIFGLDMSSVSMVQQLSADIGNKFSYCLAPFADAIPRPLALRFGQDIPALPAHSQFTLFEESEYNKHYNLRLVDISVAGHRLGFPPYTFQVRGDGRGGCLIDSGALFTQIDGNTIGVNAFEQVLQVFDAFYGSKGLTRRRPRPGAFELCYKRPPNYNDFASLTFHFNEADYTVDPQYTNAISPTYFCVAILRGSYATIIGAFHQQNKRIVYDGMFDELHFVDEDCLNNN